MPLGVNNNMHHMHQNTALMQPQQLGSNQQMNSCQMNGIQYKQDSIIQQQQQHQQYKQEPVLNQHNLHLHHHHQSSHLFQDAQPITDYS